MIELPQPTGAELWPRAEAAPAARLNKPWRAVVALVEVLLAALAVWGAFACWDAGVMTVSTTAGDGAVLVSQRYFGGPLAGAIGLGTLAALLLVDAVRQLLLAVRARHREKTD
ncbi:hypothetical protein [Amycolatopsis samaneae]|uniref:Uncharacterized protein n=1 Tax=Amycolatopsis samaneae TaxID=664691 RepID=A0ABW5GHV5_9PSEU